MVVVLPPRRCRGGRAALLHADAARPVLPLRDAVPDRRRAAPSAGARPAAPGAPARAGVAEGAVSLVRPDVQHLQLRARDPRGVGSRPARDRTRLRRPCAAAARARRHRRVGGPRGAEPLAARPHAEARPRPLAARDRALRRRERHDGAGRRRPGGRRLRVLAGEPVARALRDRPADPDPSLAQRPAAAGRGARRCEDRPVQRPLLRERLRGRARPRAAVRASALADHGRPRPAPEDQQHPRAPRGRRGAPGHRPGLPGSASALRRSGAVRRGGVLDPPARDHARSGAGDRGADPA